MKTVVFIVGQLSQPRCIKRITTIQQAGIPIKVYGYNNGLYEENLKTVSFKVDGYLTNRGNRIARRISPYKQIRKIYMENSNDSIFYVFGYDLAKKIFTIGCRNYVYEEADVNSAKFKNPLRRFFAIQFDKFLAKKSLFTVYTSQGFVDYLFPNKNKRPNYVLLPNKLNSYFREHNRDAVVKNPIDINHIKFGFVGLIRYPNTIGRFARVIAEHFPQHEFHFYGDRNVKLLDVLFGSPNIFFHGRFRNPEDLESIYSKIDICISCYDAQSSATAINVKIAEPNKLYEAIYFKTPLVVSEGTFIGTRVNELNVGFTLVSHCDEEIINFIENLNCDDLQKVVLSCQKIEKCSLLDNPKSLIETIMIFVK